VNAFGTYVHTIIEQAGHHASKDGSATIEAQHLLLAIAAQQGTTAHQVLTSVGLDQPAIREALDREFQHSLRAAGVSLAAFDLPQPSSDPERSARVGASAKLALERGVAAAARKKDLQEHKARQEQERAEVGAAWTDSGLVFTRPDGSPIHPDLITDWFRRLAVHRPSGPWTRLATTRWVCSSGSPSRDVRWSNPTASSPCLDTCWTPPWPRRVPTWASR